MEPLLLDFSPTSSTLLNDFELLLGSTCKIRLTALLSTRPLQSEDLLNPAWPVLVSTSQTKWRKSELFDHRRTVAAPASRCDDTIIDVDLV